MVEAFFLFAYDPERDFSVPIAKVLIASSDIRFFQRNKVEGKTQWEWFMEWVLTWVKRECPCLLAPFEGGGWEFFVNAESVAYATRSREELDYLPVVDLSVAPAGYIV
jgi:hypothetical protein